MHCPHFVEAFQGCYKDGVTGGWNLQSMSGVYSLFRFVLILDDYQWIADKGKHPVTWKTLSEVLCDIELQTLAGEIEADEDTEKKLN